MLTWAWPSKPPPPLTPPSHPDGCTAHPSLPIPGEVQVEALQKRVAEAEAALAHAEVCGRAPAVSLPFPAVVVTLYRGVVHLLLVARIHAKSYLPIRGASAIFCFPCQPGG
jgi:hypothetical protein